MQRIGSLCVAYETAYVCFSQTATLLVSPLTVRSQKRITFLISLPVLPRNRRFTLCRPYMNSLVRYTDNSSCGFRIRKPFGVTRYEWAFSFPEPDWWGTIFRGRRSAERGKKK